jgi:hypothetical protein
LRKYKSPGSDRTLAEQIQAGGETPAIHNLINSVWNKEELPDQWKESIIIPIHKKGDKTDCNNYRWDVTAINFIQNVIEYPSLKVKSTHMYMKLLGIIDVGFDITHQLLIKYCALVRYWRKCGSTMKQCISCHRFQEGL